jgi:Sulfotransferase family
MTMPNFFIVGAQKAGTTSLYHYLNQHPQVYMSPRKEPFFFDHEMDSKGEVVRREFGGHRQPPRFTNIAEYQALFEGVKGEKAIGEASPLYIYAPGTAERIERHVPGAKSIALLRNPADRAYSAFLYAVRIGVEPLTDFAQALREEPRRMRNGWHYVFHYRSRGLYYQQLKRYYEVFGRERIGVWLYEDMREDPANMVQSVFRFLEVDDTFTSDTSSRHNPAGVPASGSARAAMRATDKAVSVLRKSLAPSSSILPLAFKMRRAVQSRILTEPPPIDPELRDGLIEGYKEDILRLQELIGRDLSAWLEGTGVNGGGS